ncbi:heat shock factor protein 1 isoform X2 [Onthophagus taurus]|uniref:heat shock factor protein 1 isoform X2 n=1 Tax=Onthophagus taurus TaxID=166361 RepID=UPI000C20237F|nr:heat shock factor protein 1 isoform X2 [Onthophagus taurus]
MKTEPDEMSQNDNTINVPAFLSKLWRMVNDPTTDKLIAWSTGGKSFVIQHRAQFWYELLPLYYKHNNMSSFVRQLNMYGFHKLSPVDNGSVELEKDEIQFYHPMFQKGQPHLLSNIKRKVTSSKVTSPAAPMNQRPDDLTKVLQDVKNLRGRQANVDTQLEAMKQENSVLWRELVKLRQKHIKQQQIVNKLIQFLVTIYQPAGTGRMSGLGVKRRYPLMLSEGPEKKARSVEGPTIHEIDQSDQLPDGLVEELEDTAAANSEAEVDGLLSDTEIVNNTLQQIPTLSDVGLESIATQTDDLIDDAGHDERIFMSPSAQHTLLTKVEKDADEEAVGDNPDLRVAKVDYQRLNSAEDLHQELESTESELEQLKEALNGCSAFDANALLGVFNYEAPDYIDILSKGNSEGMGNADPLVSGSELAPYDANTLDFSQLFDDTSDPQDSQDVQATLDSTYFS